MLILIALMLCALLGFWVCTSKKAPKTEDGMDVWPFVPAPIMTETERKFFARLQTALPDYFVFCQVQLSRIITSDAQNAQYWFNRICRQSVDYVIVDKDAQTVLLTIELDDWTHNSPMRQKQDNKKDKALASAGIAMMRFVAHDLPSDAVLKKALHQTIKRYN